MAAVEEGLITEEEITKAAERLFTTRFLLGLFEGSEYDDILYEVVECKEHLEAAVEMARKGCVLLKNDGVLPLDKSKLKTGSEYDDILYEVVECKEHLEAAVEMARKGCVLLKNDGVLPLDKSKLKTIGVVGPNANSRAALIGNYHGTASRYITEANMMIFCMKW